VSLGSATFTQALLIHFRGVDEEAMSEGDFLIKILTPNFVRWKKFYFKEISNHLKKREGGTRGLKNGIFIF